jgi:hypothetical protein
MTGNVLIVDDDQSMAETLTKAMSRRGFVVTWGSQPYAATHRKVVRAAAWSGSHPPCWMVAVASQGGDLPDRACRGASQLPSGRQTIAEIPALSIAHLRGSTRTAAGERVAQRRAGRSVMPKPVNQSRFSLRSGAVLFSLLASLGACATLDTPRRGFAEALVVQPSQPAPWGFATVAEPSQSTLHGFAKVAQTAQPAVWGYVELPAQQTLAAQASR